MPRADRPEIAAVERGRAIAKEDSIKSLTKRADTYAQRMVWVRDNREKIVECIRARMPQDGLSVKTTGVVQPTKGIMAEAAPPTGFEWGMVA